MPTPFDTLAFNFANASCATFFDNFLANDTIADCHAVSLLLQHSNSFFHILSSSAETSRVLDTTCSEEVSECSAIMTSLAQEMLSDDNCGADFNSGNAYVKATYQDLMAYEPVYHATCLVNPTTSNYCFADAASNTTAPGDYAVYLIPLGTTFTSTTLTCNECLQATMDIYATYARENNQALDSDYIDSAKRVNEFCGAKFANTSVTLGSESVTAGGLMSLPSTRLVVTFMSLTLGLLLTGIF
ncbi:hypothetical protein N7495_004972 [Penicillium taxi]|uniref:uncharacterized protein n=1 Tax=Penicillium taxi TaxID=168475 RepID=UPI00254584A5|nr:uncharacterized protein N7495_004972 [Penicillium taxi]KAJ5893281.1 hypothetical protein N7495_004972 [Penicillium taxi]